MPSATENSENLNRLAGLDGLRALAVGLTLAHHFIERYGIQFKNPILTSFSWAGDGVGIFFVLSGFLITTLMIREVGSTGSVSLVNFYIRRIFRICPPLYAYLIFFAGYSMIYAGTPINWPSFFSSAFFYLDYTPQSPFWAYQHTWSLSVEEQFYIFWPILFMWAFIRRGRKMAILVSVILIALTPFMRLLTKLSPIYHHRQHLMLHTRLDALMCGCLFALLAGQPQFEKLYEKLAKWWWVAPSYILFFDGVGQVVLGYSYSNFIGLTVNSLFIGFFIVWLTRNRHTLVGRILNNRVVVKIGVLSYSIYIWQTFFIYYDKYTYIPSILCSPLARLVLIFGAAWLSHIVIENPSMAARKYLIRSRKHVLKEVTT